jgi:hypothetical protein
MTLSSRRSSGCGVVDGVVAQHGPQGVEAAAGQVATAWVCRLPSDLLRS